MDLSFNTISNFITDNPYTTGGCALAACGAAALGYRLANRSAGNSDAEMQAELDRQQRTKAVLDKLLITEYHLPSKTNEASELLPNCLAIACISM